jgi:hypothetical protein
MADQDPTNYSFGESIHLETTMRCMGSTSAGRKDNSRIGSYHKIRRRSTLGEDVLLRIPWKTALALLVAPANAAALASILWEEH